MKKNLFLTIKSILFSALSVLLATCFFATFVPVRAVENYNYAKSGDTSATALSAYQILENVLGETLSEVEKNYLDENEKTFLSYSGGVGISNIVTDYNDNDKILTVKASPYSYVGVNGKTVTWIPTAVEGIALDDAYSYAVKWDKAEDYVSVQYTTVFDLNDADVNGYLNSAYNAGRLASEEYIARKLAEEEYEKQTAEYERWVNEDLKEYNESLKAYEEYLVEYNIYLDKLNEYNAYLADYDKYQADLELYEQYLEDMEQYKTDYQKYRENAEAWKSYYDELEKFNANEDNAEYLAAQYQLSILSYMNLPMTSLKRTLANAILGNAVTRVLDERKALIQYAHVEERAIDLASDATYALRALINKYKSLKTDEDRYGFYIMNYEALSKNFCDLLCALDFLYQNPDYEIVRIAIAKEERTEQYEILLSQLYYIANALSAEQIPNYVRRFKGQNKEGAGYFDGSYSIGQETKRTPAQILGEEGVMDTNGNIVPLENGYPVVPNVPVPPEEELGEPPVMPKDVYEPKEPKEVAEPKEPDFMSEPTLSKEPPLPSELPPFNPSPLSVELRQAYESGILKERANVSNAKCAVTTTVIKYFVNPPVVTARFFLDGEETPVYVVDSVELGSSVEYPYGSPEKKDKQPGIIYEFEGWAYMDNDQEWVAVDLNCLIVNRGDIALYPRFSEKYELYPVTWKVYDKTVTTYFKYGETPVYDQEINGKLEKESLDGAHKYRFTGWTGGGEYFPYGKPLLPITGESVTYTAEFEESYLVTWKIGNEQVVTVAWQGDIPEYAGDTPQIPTDKRYSYSFKGWSPEISEIFSDVTYTAQFEKEYLIGNDDCVGIVNFSDGYYNATNLSGKEFTVDKLFWLATRGGYGVSVILSGATFKFYASSVRALAQSGIKKVVFEDVFTGSSYRFAVIAYDGESAELTVDATAVVTAYASFDFKNGYLTAVEEDVGGLNYAFDDTTLTFNMEVGLTYILENRYFVNVKAENATVTTSCTRAAAGQTVNVTVTDLEAGTHVHSIYVITDNNTEIEVVDGYFVMPNGSVTVGVILAYSEYRIAFVADGKIISARYYKYGETVEIPAEPYKASDGVYEYEFGGWDKPVVTVCGDAEYVAVFTKEPVKHESAPPSKLTVLLTVLEIAVPTVVALGGGATAFFVIRARRKKKSKAQKEENNE